MWRDLHTHITPYTLHILRHCNSLGSLCFAILRGHRRWKQIELEIVPIRNYVCTFADFEIEYLWIVKRLSTLSQSQGIFACCLLFLLSHLFGRCMHTAENRINVLHGKLAGGTINSNRSIEWGNTYFYLRVDSIFRLYSKLSGGMSRRSASELRFSARFSYSFDSIRLNGLN